ncbi:hypothetical protein ACFONA_18615 [Sphingomonas hylomeconis]|uniref:Uncharacterized protein n=1 Tax=Sphingomonas hylomeconis TaxID=1395958 RepID=A0ABV7SZ34_9SPHN
MDKVIERQRCRLARANQHVDHLGTRCRRAVEQALERPADVDLDHALPIGDEADQAQAQHRALPHRALGVLRVRPRQYPEQGWQVAPVPRRDLGQRRYALEPVASDHQFEQCAIDRPEPKSAREFDREA